MLDDVLMTCKQKSRQTSTSIYFDEADAKIMELLLLGKIIKKLQLKCEYRSPRYKEESEI